MRCDLLVQAKPLVSVFFVTPERHIVVSELVPHESFINSKIYMLYS